MADRLAAVVMRTAWESTERAERPQDYLTVCWQTPRWHRVPLPLPSCDWHYLANYIASVVLSNQLLFPPSKKAPIKFLSEWQLSIWILGCFAKSVDSCWLLGLFGQPVSPSFYRLQLPDLFEWDRQLMEIGCTTFVMLDVSAFHFAMLTTLN